MPFFLQVADFLGQIPNSVVVEGHTDNIRPDAQKWPDNRHLAQRAPSLSSTHWRTTESRLNGFLRVLR